MQLEYVLQEQMYNSASRQNALNSILFIFKNTSKKSKTCAIGEEGIAQLVELPNTRNTPSIRRGFNTSYCAIAKKGIGQHTPLKKLLRELRIPIVQYKKGYCRSSIPFCWCFVAFSFSHFFSLFFEGGTVLEGGLFSRIYGRGQE